jgi:hypothetical protein
VQLRHVESGALNLGLLTRTGGTRRVGVESLRLKRVESRGLNPGVVDGFPGWLLGLDVIPE